MIQSNSIYHPLADTQPAPESRRKAQDFKIDEKIFKGMSSFKYLGNATNNGNRNDNCVKERMHAGNRVYFVNLGTFKSKIISQAVKIQVYKTLIRPVATYTGKKHGH
jgi:hypothetical protein